MSHSVPPLKSFNLSPPPLSPSPKAIIGPSQSQIPLLHRFPRHVPLPDLSSSSSSSSNQAVASSPSPSLLNPSQPSRIPKRRPMQLLNSAQSAIQAPALPSPSPLVISRAHLQLDLSAIDEDNRDGEHASLSAFSFLSPPSRPASPALSVRGAIQQQQEISRQEYIQNVLALFTSAVQVNELKNVLENLIPHNNASSSAADEPYIGLSDLFKEGSEAPAFNEREAEQLVERFIDRLPSIEHWTSYIAALKALEPGQRPLLCAHLLPLFEGTKAVKGVGCPETLQAWSETPAQEKESLLYQLARNLKTLPTDIQRACAMQTFNRLHVADREKGRETILTIFSQKLTPDDAKQIVAALNFLEKEDLLNFLETIFPLVSDHSNFSGRGSLVEKMVDIYPIHKESVVTIRTILIWINLTVHPLFHSRKIDAFFDLLNKPNEANAIEKTVRNLNSYTLEQINLISAKLMLLNSPWQQKLMLLILRMLPQPPENSVEHIYAFVSLYQHELDSLLTQGIFCSIPELLNSALQMITPERRLEAINKWAALKTRKEVCKKNVTAKLFNDDAQLKTVSREYLKNLLENLSNRKQAHTLATFYLDLFFDLTEQDPLDITLVALSQQVEALANTVNVEKNNPYSVFEKLNVYRELVKLASPYELGMKFNRAFVLNLTGFQARINKVKFTVGDLHAGINANSMKSLFQSMSERVGSLSGADFLACKTAIQRKFYLNGFDSLAELEDQVLGFGKAIPTLLKVEGEAEQPISESTFYLYAILRYICDLRDDELRAGVPVNTPLSPYENAFMDFCSKVWECNTGQDDGIADYYSSPLLPPKYRHSAKVIPESEIVKKVEKGIELAMQQKLLKLFKDEALHAVILNAKVKPEESPAAAAAAAASDDHSEMSSRERAPSASSGDSQAQAGAPILVEDRQFSHLVTSLKNHFHREMGLIHTVKFDFGTGILAKSYTELLEKNPRLILKLIASFMTMDSLIAMVKTSVKEAFDAHTYGFQGLQFYLEENLVKVPVDDFSISDLIQLGDDDELLGVTDLAAVTILTAMGYVCVKA